jgi:hypothetical protein
MSYQKMKINDSLANMRRNQPVLSMLASSDTNSKYKRAIINSADRRLIQAICDATYNVLNGNIQISPEQRSQLIRYKNLLRQLIQRSPLSYKKNILVRSTRNQQGGFLPALLAAIAGPILGGFSGWVADKVFNRSKNDQQPEQE